MEWILTAEELPKADGLYAISYDGKTWRQGIWKSKRNAFMESYENWMLEMPKWWADVPAPEKKAVS